MNVCFSATQAVELAVPQQPIAIQHYLRQPHRLVHALVDPSRMEQLSPETFRLKMRSLNFLTFTLQPTVDLPLTSQSDGSIQLRSIDCEIRGIEYINQRFHLDLRGHLVPVQKDNGTSLQGQADLSVQVELPPPLWFTPKPILEAAGTSLLRSVLLTIKQRLMHQLLSDYQAWVAQQSSAPSIRSSRDAIAPEGI